MNEPLKPDDILAQSRVIVDGAGVDAALDDLADRIGERYRDLPLTLVAVMTGGLMVTAWLAARLHRPLRLDFVHATRYRSGLSGDSLDYRVGPHLDANGRHVLIVDDIFDEGETLQAIVKDYRQRGAESVATAVLVRKLHDRGLPRDFPDFHGVDVPDEYVFGCGMDAWEEWRHLYEIRALSGATE